MNAIENISKHYSALLTNLSALQSNFIDNGVPVEYEYKDKDRLQILAFRILAHAGIENYFEERVIEIANSARYIINNPSDHHNDQLIKSYKVANSILIHYSGNAITINDRSKCDTLKKEKDEFFEKSFTAYNYSIKQNHGIKEINIIRMLSPIGYPLEAIDPIWLASIDSFGAKRGAVAHSYPLHSITKTASYQDEAREIKGLIDGIKPIDLKFNEMSPNIDT